MNKLHWNFLHLILWLHKIRLSGSRSRLDLSLKKKNSKSIWIQISYLLWWQARDRENIDWIVSRKFMCKTLFVSFCHHLHGLLVLPSFVFGIPRHCVEQELFFLVFFKSSFCCCFCHCMCSNGSLYLVMLPARMNFWIARVKTEFTLWHSVCLVGSVVSCRFGDFCHAGSCCC